MRVGDIIVKKIEDDPGFLDDMKSRFEQEIKKLLEIAGQSGESTFQEYCKQYKKAYVYACIPFLADFSLIERCDRILSKLDKAEQQSCRAAFSYPAGKSWALKEETARLEATSIEAHWKEWSWLAYDFEGEELGKEYFQPEPDRARIEAQVKEAEENRAEKERYASSFNETELRLLKALGELAYFKEYRKGLFTKSHLMIEPVLKEMGKMNGISLAQVRYLWPDEIKQAKSQEFSRIADERRAFSVYVQEGDSHRVLTGDEGRNFLNEHYREEIEDTGELKGTVACMGKVKGTVKVVITVKDIDKMEKGDILVSAMTNPDLLPAIMKAAAIVTDTGGLTCHAAIVSRELKTPCIIGTDHATKILKDGDVVEVDAEEGVVRKK
jgi:phosphohistidine swiveling domain-containing protein